MATGTFKLYGPALKAAFNKEIDWDTDAIKLMLCSSSYVPDQDAHDYKNDVTNEVTGTNWAAGGVTLANCTLTYTGATNVLKLDADDVSVSNVTLTGGRVAVIYDSSPETDATRPLIGYAVLDSDLSPNAGPLTITFDSAGIFTITPAA